MPLIPLQILDVGLVVVAANEKASDAKVTESTIQPSSATLPVGQALSEQVRKLDISVFPEQTTTSE
jgi:hypothetical protein